MKISTEFPLHEILPNALSRLFSFSSSIHFYYTRQCNSFYVSPSQQILDSLRYVSKNLNFSMLWLWKSNVFITLSLSTFSLFKGSTPKLKQTNWFLFRFFPGGGRPFPLPVFLGVHQGNRFKKGTMYEALNTMILKRLLWGFAYILLHP